MGIKFNSHGSSYVRTLGVILLALALFGFAPAAAQAGLIDLGAAGPQNWAVLSLAANASGEGIHITHTNITGATVANVGAYHGDVWISSTAKGSGGIYLSLPASSYEVTGSNPSDDINNFALGLVQNATSNALLNAAHSDAYTKSTALAGLGPTVSIVGPLEDSLTINRTGAVTVVSISGGIDYGSGDVLKFTGNPGDVFIVNIPAPAVFSLSSNATVQVGAGIDPLNVVFNYLGTTAFADTANDFSGILLAPYADAQIHIAGSTWFGEIIAKHIDLASNSVVNNPYVPIPLPASAVLLGSGLVGLGLIGWRRRR